MKYSNINDEMLFENNKTTLEVKEISINSIIIDDESKRNDINTDNLQELIESIDKIGLINPITCIKDQDQYRLVAGYRRLLAHNALGKDTIHAKIIDNSDALQILVHLDENAKRERFSETEEAIYFSKVIERLQITAEHLAKIVGKTPAYVSQRLSILKWTDELRKALADGVLTYSACRELARIKDIEQQTKFMNYAIDGVASWSTVQRWVNDYFTVLKATEESRLFEVSEEPAKTTADQMPTPFTESVQDLAMSTLYNNINTTPAQSYESRNFESGDESYLDAPTMGNCSLCNSFTAVNDETALLICEDCQSQLQYYMLIAETANKLGLIEQINAEIEKEETTTPDTSEINP